MSRVVFRRIFPVWVVMSIVLVAVGSGVLAFTQRINQQRDADLRAIQLAGCVRLRETVRDYNAQYGQILRALVRVQKRYPGEPVSREVIRAFSAPGFPLVTPPMCSTIHIY